MALLPLNRKVALVTGGSRGIGRALAVAFAQSGAHVAITYRESPAAADAVVDEIGRHGVQGAAFRSDQGQPGLACDLIAAVEQRFGKLDILVNNAGIAALQRLGEGGDWAECDRMWAVNTLGVVATIRAAAEIMADEGRIISIGSVSGRKAGMSGSADYCASKAALGGYTRGAAHDLAARRITVNMIESGMMSSDMAHNMPEVDRARISAGIPLGRFGSLDEIAALAVFLASPPAQYITGATLTIDGGFAA